MASNVNFAYRYHETKYSVNFEVTVLNLTNEIYMIDRSSGKYYYANNEDFTISNYLSGKTIQFDFYARNTECGEDALLTKYVVLPSFNPYYTSNLCKGIESFALCQKWLKQNMTYKEFHEGVTAYLNGKTEEPSPIPPKEEKVEWDIIFIQFWSKYYIYILLTIIVIGGIVLYRYKKKTDL